MIEQRQDGRKTLRWVMMGWLGGVMLGALVMMLFLPLMVSAGLLAFLGAVGAWGWRVFQSPGEVFYTRALFASQLAGVVSAGFAVIASYYFSASQALEWVGLDWLYAAGLVGGASLLLRWIQPMPPLVKAEQPTIIHHMRWSPFLIGLGMLAVTAEINGNVFDPSFLTRTNSHVQFWLLVGGIILVTVGIAGRRYTQVSVELPDGSIRTQSAPMKPRRWTISRGEVVVVLVILLLATGTRVYQLGTAQRFWIDEVHFSNPVLHFEDSDRVELLIPFSSVAAFPYVFPYMQRQMVNIFGNDLMGLRMLSALTGVAGVLALYLLARELFGRRVAWMSAALLAVFPVHLQFSRIGLNNIVDPLLGTLVCYFIVRAWKYPTHARGNLAWAGACLGLTQYFYEGGRFLFPALIAFWLIAMGVLVHVRVGERLVRAVWRDNAALLRHHLRREYRRFLQVGVAMIMVAVLVALPIYYTLIARQDSLGSRMESAGMGTRVTQHFDDPLDLVEHVFRRVNESFLIHVTIPEAQLYYGGDHPFLLPFVTPFFLLGGMYCLWAMLFGFLRRDAEGEIEGMGAILLVLWVLLTWFGNALLQESRISARYVVSFPAVSLVVALGVRWVLVAIWEGMARMQSRVAVVVIVALIVPQIWFYFVPQMARFNEQFRDDRGRNLDVDDALFRSRDFPVGTMIHIVDNPAWYETDVNNIMRYLAPESLKQVKTLVPRQFNDAYLDGVLLTVDNAFYVAPDDLLTVRRLLRRFPQIEGPFYTEFEASVDKGFALYYLPAVLQIRPAG